MKTSKNPIVAGIDVGGARKGFHGVALVGGAYQAQLHTMDAAAMARWLREIGAQAIGVDAPCRWSLDGRARPAERELMSHGMHCFASPTREAAVRHPSNYYGWMLNGEALYQAIEPSHPLCAGLPLRQGQTCCFETFPHAVSCALTGHLVSAKHKRVVRRVVLEQAGIFSLELRNIDWIDAALCALAAHRLAAGHPCHAYGEPVTGLIITPQT